MDRTGLDALFGALEGRGYTLVGPTVRPCDRARAAPGSASCSPPSCGADRTPDRRGRRRDGGRHPSPALCVHRRALLRPSRDRRAGPRVPRGRLHGHRLHRLDVLATPLSGALTRGSTHAFGLAETIDLARMLERLPPRLTVYGIEGECFSPGDELSPAVRAAVDAVHLELQLSLGTRKP